MTSGSTARQRATARRCCWPPESSPGRWLTRSANPTRSLLADALAEAGLAVVKENPAHRRSSLIALTEKGKRTFAKMRAREVPVVANIATEFDAQDLDRATAICTSLNRFSAGWAYVVEPSEGRIVAHTSVDCPAQWQLPILRWIDAALISMWHATAVAPALADAAPAWAAASR